VGTVVAQRIQMTALPQLVAAFHSLVGLAAVFVAAVADWRPAKADRRKAKKSTRGDTLALAENPDIIATMSRPAPGRPGLVVGFAAETPADPGDLEELARAKRLRKGCDWIVANDVSQPEVMGGDRNAVLFLTAEGTETWGLRSKSEIARELALRIAAALS
jgi:phosphopantothenoylcysteine decarboxylase/phosphopantothenate--cysteine ligase